MLKTLEELIKTIRERGEKPELASYTKKLFDDKKLCISKVRGNWRVNRSC